MNTKLPVETSAPGSQPPPRKLRVLVADDNRDIVLTLSMLLRDEGYEVRGAYNGADALKAARYLEFDAIILDIEMPELSGYAIAQELRRASHGRRGPVLIAISGKWNKPSERLLSQAVGFEHHLTKPCDPSEILAILRRLPPAGEAGA